MVGGTGLALLPRRLVGHANGVVRRRRCIVHRTRLRLAKGRQSAVHEPREPAVCRNSLVRPPGVAALADQTTVRVAFTVRIAAGRFVTAPHVPTGVALQSGEDAAAVV
jgi:hypothetical protein